MDRHLKGKKFGRWTIIERDKSNHLKCICKCRCGTVKSIFIHSLKQGLSRSCGCYRKTKKQVKNIPFVVKKYKKGWTLRQIGEYFGVSKQRIHQILSEEGVVLLGLRARRQLVAKS